jgi:hypothetical protein
MPVPSDAILMVRLPSGNRAVYAVEQHHMHEVSGLSEAERALAMLERATDASST